MYIPMQEAPDSVVADSARQDTTILHDYLGDVGDMVARGRWAEAGDFLQQTTLESLTAYMPRLLGAIILVSVFYGLYRLLYLVLRRMMERSVYLRQGLQTLVLQGLRLACFAGIFLIGLDQLGLNITTILTGVGIAGLALGFAARETLENVMSGVAILADASYKIGDWVIVQGTQGEVQEITLRSTRILTRKKELLVLPNRMVANEMVLNHSTTEGLRVEVPFSVGYPEDPDEVREIVLGLTDGDDRLLLDRPAKVIVEALGDSGVDMQLWVFPRDALYENELKYDYSERILAALKEAHIEIPFPHVQLKTDAGNQKST